MTKKLVALLFVAILALAAQAQEVKTFQGTFVEVEQGDYFHLNCKDAKGQVRSFWMIAPSPTFDPLLETPEKFRGKKIEVKYHTVKRDIPENGGPMELDEVISIRIP